MALLGLDTFEKRGIFLVYIVLGCAMRLFIYGSKREGAAPEYNPNSLLLFVSITKLFIATTMYLQQDGSVSFMMKQIQCSLPLCLRYAVPALSYAIYDTLTFFNLANIDPVTYNILLQMRTAATGLVWQTFFQQRLTRNQWIAIVLFTCACMMQSWGKQGGASQDSRSNPGLTFLAVIPVGVQILFGVFSSVFNEVLLKEKGAIGANLQNMYMYSWSIVLNVLWLSFCPSKVVCKSPLSEALKPHNLAVLLHRWIFPSVVVLSSIGIVTSFFLKRLDSVRKLIACTIEIFIDVILARFFFGISILPSTVFAALLASAGVLIYSQKKDILAKLAEMTKGPECAELDVEMDRMA
eukprot:TRINITY_DN28492_c0_g1_i1.p1 TRINITY_DN28492_c0_g1~~TRINITY_DN28492_c0_g1_i1.p1  ORF type:complete len:352 (-),score=53.64 TRINITY_DN28492_c0_g1_i1:514-1569(-)